VTAPRSAILSCEGTALSSAERRLFTSANPFGLILFKRNVESASQLIKLTSEFRSCVGRADAPVLIDQEGGRVARLSAPEWDTFPPAAAFGALYKHDGTRGIAAAKLLGRMLAAQLRPLGITVNCAPVLDLHRPETTQAIGDRAFSSDPRAVSVLARAVCDGMRVGGVLPVIKHMPGHGRASADSHEELPVVNATWPELQASDFVPFMELRDMPLAMTAHILYPQIDPDLCATRSPLIISQVIREQIGYNGLLMSDDITMKALEGAPDVIARDVIAAGCDVALYCKHDVDHMTAICAAVPKLSVETQLRWQKAQSWLSPMDLFDLRLAKAEFSNFFPHHAWI